MFHSLKEFLERLSGYWIYKRKHLPIGTDLYTDIILKLRINPNCIFDVGANVGQSVVRFKSWFPNSTIHSFEPIRSSFDKLLTRTKGFNNVHCYPMALGEKEEMVTINLLDEKDSVQNSLRNKSSDGASAEVHVSTLDAFVKKNEVDQIDLLKIDTEGWEIQVLIGAEESLGAGRIKLVFVEVGLSSLNEHHTHLADLMKKLEDHAFHFYGLYDVSNRSIKRNLNYANALFAHKSIIDRL